MDNRFNDHTGAKQDQPSGLPLSDAGARKAAAAVEEVAAKIQNNAALTVAEMRDFADELKAAEVEVGGRRFCVEQLRSDPELGNNASIWKEILSGEYDRYKELTLLTPAVAAALMGLGDKWLFLDRLTSLDPDTAAALVGFRLNWLSLNALSALEPDTAAALAGFVGNRILLNGLTSLNPATATALARFRGCELYLNGLTSISPEIAAALAGFPGTIHCQPDVHAQIDRYKTPSS